VQERKFPKMFKLRKNEEITTHNSTSIYSKEINQEVQRGTLLRFTL